MRVLVKVSFGSEKLFENTKTILEKLIQLKPSSSKGIYLKSITISTTMGPGFKIDPIEVRALLK